jgi:hypothetical protein
MTDTTDYLEEAKTQLDMALDTDAEGYDREARQQREWANTYALVSIAQSLAKLASAVVPDSAEGYPPALNIMDTAR